MTRSQQVTPHVNKCQSGTSLMTNWRNSWWSRDTTSSDTNPCYPHPHCWRCL